MTRATAIHNYEYLDVLDRAWAASGLERRRVGTVCDVGCASFWYAAALDCFFTPQRLIGVDVEGYRMFKDGHTRIDYASGYLAALSNASFVVADYQQVDLPADVITAWFPFVTPAAILAWRLPLSLLAPRRLFDRVCRNLQPEGLFVMVNHGHYEAQVAGDLCAIAGLTCVSRLVRRGVFSGYRTRTPVLTIWVHGA